MSMASGRVMISGLTVMVMSAAAWAAPDYWDPRLNQICDLYLEDVSDNVPAGSYYWRLVSASFEDEVEAGGSHHVFYRCLDAGGNPIEGRKIWQSWWYTNETGSASDYTKGSLDNYWGNIAMYGNCPGNNCGWPYNGWVDTASGLSDKVWGMGMHNPSGTPCNAHVSFRLIFRWTQAGPPPSPSIGRSPTSISETVTQGDNLPDGSFNVWNAGGGTLNYTVTDNAGWLNTNPSSDSSTGETDTISILYTTESLGLGVHNGTITITDSNADNSPRTISVSVTVKAPTIPGDFDGDGDVDQSDFGMFQICFTGEGHAQEDPACIPAKMDGDVDVDQLDFIRFEGCMSGPNVLGDPDCNPA